MEPAGGVFGGLEGNIWQTRIALRTKLWLYDPYLVPVLIYGSETWAVTKSKERKIDTFGWKFSSAYLQRPVIGFHHQHGNSEKKGCATAVHSHSEKASLSWVTLPGCLKVPTPVVFWSQMCLVIFGDVRVAGRDRHGWELWGQIWISWTPHWREPSPLTTWSCGDRWSMTLLTVQRSLCESRLPEKKMKKKKKKKIKKKKKTKKKGYSMLL